MLLSNGQILSVLVFEVLIKDILLTYYQNFKSMAKKSYRN